MIDFHDPDFLQDPYPILNAGREETAIFRQAKEENRAPSLPTTA
ncbi:MAG: hypothetical protein V3S38_05240 [Acidimicrobiia bacterium]